MKHCVLVGLLLWVTPIGMAQSSTTERTFRWPGSGFSREVDRVARARALAAVREILRQAELEVETIDDTSRPLWDSRAHWMATVGATQAIARDFEGAQRFIDRLDGGDRDHVQAQLAAAQAYLSGAAVALRTAALVKDPCVRDQTLNDIALAQANTGHVQDALRTANRIRDLGCGRLPKRTAAIRGIAEVQALRGDVEGVRQTLVLVRSHPSEARRTIALTQAYASDLPGALRTASTIRSVLERARAITEIALIRVVQHDDQGALDSIARIESNELRTDALRDLLDFQAASGDVSGVHATAHLLSPQPDIVKSRLTLAQTRIRDLTAAWETLSTIRSGRLRTWAAVELARAQADAGDLDAARRTVGVIRNEHLPPDRRKEDWLQAIVARAQAHSGDTTSALRTVALIKHLKEREDAEREVAEARTRSGDPSAVLALARARVTPRDRVKFLLFVGAQPFAWCILPDDFPDDSCQYARFDLRSRAFSLWPLQEDSAGTFSGS